MLPEHLPITLTALIPLDGLDRCQCGGTTFVPMNHDDDCYCYTCGNCGDLMLVEWFAVYDTSRDSDWYHYDNMADAIAMMNSWHGTEWANDIIATSKYATFAVMRIVTRQSLRVDEDDNEYNPVWDRQYHPNGTDLVFYRKTDDSNA